MKTISTFVFVHKQDIILEYKKLNKFNILPNKKYVLVGKNPFNLVENMDDVIVCQKFKGNIEDYPRFTSYTGWYILWKYNLIETDFVNASFEKVLLLVVLHTPFGFFSKYSLKKTSISKL